jgi:transposase
VIERACVEDIAFRVIAANEVPDHTTIARFRQRHEAALAGLFGDILGLCAEAGLAKVGVIAIDGTKVRQVVIRCRSGLESRPNPNPDEIRPSPL